MPPRQRAPLAQYSPQDYHSVPNDFCDPPMSQSIPRLEMSALDPKLAEALGPRVKRLGYLGEFFKCAGHQPRSLLAFLEFTEALKDALPDNLTEIVVFSVACSAQNAYERHQHERLCEKLGFSRAWITAAMQLAPDSAPELSDVERALQRLALAALKNYGRGVRAELEAAIALIGHEQAMAVLMLIGRYVTHAIVVNALELEPPVPSIFAEGAR